MTFETAGKRIQVLTELSRKDVVEVELSYLEELGELCAELKIYLGVAGTQHKICGPDGIYGECADVWICALSMYYKDYGNVAGEWLKSMISQPPNLSLRELVKKIVNWRENKAATAYYVMQIALYFNEDPNDFLKKINEKLDKWEKNVQFVTVVEA